MEAKRCTGDCCKVFSLPYTPEQLKEKFDNNRLDKRDRQVPGMVIYLGQHEKYEGWPTTGLPEHLYTCKNFDRETNNCMVYETRPGMCSDYPYGTRCRYESCTGTHADVLVTRLLYKVRSVRHKTLIDQLEKYDEDWDQSADVEGSPD